MYLWDIYILYIYFLEEEGWIENYIFFLSLPSTGDKGSAIVTPSTLEIPRKFATKIMYIKFWKCSPKRFFGLMQFSNSWHSPRKLNN